MGGNNGTPLRGLEATAMSSVGSGKFGRMFRWLSPAFPPDSRTEPHALRMFGELANLMVSADFDEHVAKGPFTRDPLGQLVRSADADLMTANPERENATIAAGYTYLGQFIDHDITFDPASSLQQQNDPDTLEDFRTPRLDLDSLYGRGPEDQPYLYTKTSVPQANGRTTTLRVKFRHGDDYGIEGQTRFDLPRDPEQTAIIGDKRNDQNRIVSQLHGLFLAFHNRVFDDLSKRRGIGDASVFSEAQRIVRWCYQWIVLNDYLPKVCDARVLATIRGAAGSRPTFSLYAPKSGSAFIPVEFAVAAFRFGHSMIRPSYALNELAQTSALFVPAGSQHTYRFARIPTFARNPKAPLDSLAGFSALPTKWGIDWQ